NGSAAQTITSSSANFFGNLTVNKSNGLVNLASNISVTGTLTMTSGNINTGANILTLGTDIANRGTFLYTSGVIITGSTGGFKRWFINSSVSNRVFPVGTATSNNSVTLSFTGAPTTGGTLTARFISLDPGTNSYAVINDAGYSIDAYSSAGYWQIEAGDGLTDGIYSLTLRGQGFNPSGTEITNYSHLRVLKRTGSGFDWIADGTHINASGSNNDPTIQRGELSGFSQFTMGGNVADGNPLQGLLPIELSLFSYSINANNVGLNWITESEKNNKGFEIFRRDINSDWRKIGYVEGNGNTNSEKMYTFKDMNLVPSKYNYRLKQFDYNGNFEYFNLNSDVIIGTPGKFSVNQNFPNPFNPVTKISYVLPSEENVSLKIYDVSGKEITNLINKRQKAGYYSVDFNGQNISSGIYFYRLIAGNNIVTKKMLLIK
ncbi:MAG: T9SS type A sorting domain-containing protein, partial [Ignavibacteriae bacterium]|nr:T9SS type A sorting domain-containing protein [Ignavibacteriota bacterium]